MQAMFCLLIMKIDSAKSIRVHLCKKFLMIEKTANGYLRDPEVKIL